MGRSGVNDLRVGGAQIDTDSFARHSVRAGFDGWRGKSARAKMEGLKNLGLIFISPERGLIGHVFPTKKYPEGSGTFERIRKRRDPNPLEPPTSTSQFVAGSTEVENPKYSKW